MLEKLKEYIFNKETAIHISGVGHITNKMTHDVAGKF